MYEEMKFSNTVTMCLPIDKINFEKLFENYLEYEEYDSEKQYEKSNDEYTIKLYKIMDINDQNRKVKYVVKEKTIDQEELKELELFCQCQNCVNSSKNSTCSCCVGCIKAGKYYASSDVIAASRKARDESKKNTK